MSTNCKTSVRDTAKDLVAEYCLSHPGSSYLVPVQREWLAQLVLMGQWLHLSSATQPKVVLAGFDSSDIEQLRRDLLHVLLVDNCRFSLAVGVSSITSKRTGKPLPVITVGHKPSGIHALVTKLTAPGFELFPCQFVRDLIDAVTEEEKRGTAVLLAEWLDISEISHHGWQLLKSELQSSVAPLQTVVVATAKSVSAAAAPDAVR